MWNGDDPNDILAQCYNRLCDNLLSMSHNTNILQSRLEAIHIFFSCPLACFTYIINTILAAVFLCHPLRVTFMSIITLLTPQDSILIDLSLHFSKFPLATCRLPVVLIFKLTALLHNAKAPSQLSELKTPVQLSFWTHILIDSSAVFKIKTACLVHFEICC